MIAVYPGSFDPPTLGHQDVIKRSAKLVDTLYVAVLVNSSKKSFLTVEKRVEMLEKITADIPNVHVASFSGLLVEFCQQKNANAIIRGLRAVMDFDYEFQMALSNRALVDELETLFISTSVEFLYLSSSMVKEILFLGGPITNMVPKEIEDELYQLAKEHLKEVSQ